MRMIECVTYVWYRVGNKYVTPFFAQRKGTNPIFHAKCHKVQELGTRLTANSHQSGLSNEVLHDFMPQEVLGLQAVKLKTARFFHHLLYKKRTFNFDSLLAVTPKPLLIEKCSIPHLKTLTGSCLEPKCKDMVTLLLCATPLHFVAFHMKNWVCAFCFCKHCNGFFRKFCNRFSSM